MSLLASISVIQCDDCRAVTVLKTNAEFHLFSSTWLEGFDLHLCPGCRQRSRNKGKIADDRARQEQIRQMISKTNRKRREENDNAR